MSGLYNLQLWTVTESIFHSASEKHFWIHVMESLYSFKIYWFNEKLVLEKVLDEWQLQVFVHGLPPCKDLQTIHTHAGTASATWANPEKDTFILSMLSWHQCLETSLDRKKHYTHTCTTIYIQMNLFLTSSLILC